LRTNHQFGAVTNGEIISLRGLAFQMRSCASKWDNTEGLLDFAGAMAVAIGLDALLGWPGFIVAHIGHPVIWLGALIGALDTHWNRATDAAWQRRLAGVAAALLVILVAAGLGFAVQNLMTAAWSRIVVVGILAAPFVATRSLYEHVRAVAQPLGAGDIGAARAAIAMIVGRDVAGLDEAGVARAAIESLAENTSDGIVAPVFWGALFGLPGIIGYKAINTLDSMIGHLSERHRDFGWASARIDDVANLVPARLTGLLFAMVAAQPISALTCMWRDATNHRSINAGWPEAAMAGALGLRLCGPRVYHGELADEPWLNAGAGDPKADDVIRALGLYIRAMICLAGLLVILALV
jgi:adenosylcobinamide-phosphate synthase